MGKLHAIFVAIGLAPLGQTIVGVGIIGEAARVAGPHVPFRRPFGHPFGQHLASPPGLGDSECENTGFKGVLHPRHRPDQRVAIGRIGDRTVDDLGYPRRAEQRHPRHRISHVPFQPVQIIGIKLEREILGQGVIRRHPMGAAVAFIGAKVEAGLFLPQVIARVHIPQQRQFVANLFRPGLDLCNRFAEQILMAHHHHRHPAATERDEPLTDPLGIIARRVHHDVAGDIAACGVDHPFILNPRHPGGGGMAQNGRPPIPRTLGQGLGQLRRINVAIGWVV